MREREVVPRVLVPQRILLLILYFSVWIRPKYITAADVQISLSSPNGYKLAHSPHLSPSTDLQPSVPFQASSPMMPFTYNTTTKLSGLCPFNFSSAESVLRVTAIDCWESLAPYLANAVCCPQFEASLVILIGQSSNHTGNLALNAKNSKHCISDVEQILESYGANKILTNICSINPTNLTSESCPVIDFNQVDSILDASTLLAACEKLDVANECCNQVCQNAVTAEAGKLALIGIPIIPEETEIVNDCKKIVLRWLAAKLDPSSTNRVLRAISSCNLDKACPLVFPDIKNVSKECGYQMTGQTSCCGAMENYMSHLQEQSFITAMQALNCAALLGQKMQSGNVSRNVYNLCHTKLKDFSLQVDSKASGCLFPSLLSDVTFDKTSGIGFICDLNDNAAAAWPSGPLVPVSSCNKSNSNTLMLCSTLYFSFFNTSSHTRSTMATTTTDFDAYNAVTAAIVPHLPKPTSGQRGLHIGHLMFASIFIFFLVL